MTPPLGRGRDSTRSAHRFIATTVTGTTTTLFFLALADGTGELQFVSSVTEPFCQACDQLRLTADGQLRTCLLADWETDLRRPLREGASAADEIAAIVRGAVARKEPGHGMPTRGGPMRGAR